MYVYYSLDGRHFLRHARLFRKLPIFSTKIESRNNLEFALYLGCIVMIILNISVFGRNFSQSSPQILSEEKISELIQAHGSEIRVPSNTTGENYKPYSLEYVTSFPSIPQQGVVYVIEHPKQSN